MKTIAERLIEHRKKYGLTQIEMTQKIGCAYASYRWYEKGVMKPKSYLARIEEILEDNNTR